MSTQDSVTLITSNAIKFLHNIKSNKIAIPRIIQEFNQIVYVVPLFWKVNTENIMMYINFCSLVFGIMLLCYKSNMWYSTFIPPKYKVQGRTKGGSWAPVRGLRLDWSNWKYGVSIFRFTHAKEFLWTLSEISARPSNFYQPFRRPKIYKTSVLRAPIYKLVGVKNYWPDLGAHMSRFGSDGVVVK